MDKLLEHPEISRCLRTGHPARETIEEDDYEQDAYDSYGDQCFEERRDRILHGE